jgi:hypothetical protein
MINIEYLRYHSTPTEEMMYWGGNTDSFRKTADIAVVTLAPPHLHPLWPPSSHMPGCKHAVCTHTGAITWPSRLYQQAGIWVESRKWLHSGSITTSHKQSLRNMAVTCCLTVTEEFYVTNKNYLTMDSIFKHDRSCTPAVNSWHLIIVMSWNQKIIYNTNN